MKTRFKPGGSGNRDRGMATVIVLALLFLMVAFIAGNSANLHSLEQELRRVERLQLRKYQVAPGANVRRKPAATRPESGPNATGAHHSKAPERK